MLTAFGFDAGATMHPGDRYDVTTRSGDRLAGTIDVFAPGVNLSGSVESWNHSFLIIEIEPGRGQCRPAAWFSLYGSAREDAPALQERLRTMITAAFADT